MVKFTTVEVLLNQAKKFIKEEKFKKIIDPDREFLITELSGEIVSKLKLLNSEVTITRKALKHIVNSRGMNEIYLEDIISSIPCVLNYPTKIVNNSRKRPQSFLFARMNGKAKGVILEIIRNSDKNQVVSAFYIRKGYYEKLKDISGRVAVPPSALR